MFQASVMIEDKNLAKFLLAVDGLVIFEQAPRPVRAAKVKKGRVTSTLPAGKSLPDEVERLIRELGIEIISGDDFKKLIVQAGAAQQSSGYLAQAMRTRKVFGKFKKGTGYPVLV